MTMIWRPQRSNSAITCSGRRKAPDQCKPPRKVVRVTEDGLAFVRGSPGGLPVSELTVVDAPTPRSRQAALSRIAPTKRTASTPRRISTSTRLGVAFKITAEVDLDSL